MDYQLRIGSQIRATLSTGIPGTFSHRPFKITGTVERIYRDHVRVLATDGQNYSVLTSSLRVIGN